MRALRSRLAITSPNTRKASALSSSRSLRRPVSSSRSPRRAALRASTLLARMRASRASRSATAAAPPPPSAAASAAALAAALVARALVAASPNAVVTAAHCITEAYSSYYDQEVDDDYNWFNVAAEDIIVAVGIHDVTDAENVDDVIVLDVISIVIHPQFDLKKRHNPVLFQGSD